MNAAELGNWEPLGIAEMTRTFGGASFRWWVSGGRALELHLGRNWREHEDTDVGVLRQDAAPGLSTVLAGWDIHVAAAGRLEPWDGGELSGRPAREQPVVPASPSRCVVARHRD